MRAEVVGERKLVPDKAHDLITNEARLIAGRVDNITEFAVARGNKNLSNMLAEGFEVICTNLGTASFNVGNSETSKITPEMKEIMRKDIDEYPFLLLQKLELLRDNAGKAWRYVPLQGNVFEEALIKEELDRVHATEDIIRESRLLSLGCAGLDLPPKQKLSVLSQLSMAKDLVSQCIEKLRGESDCDFYFEYLDGSEL
jgi:hypothetical protein